MRTTMDTFVFRIALLVNLTVLVWQLSTISALLTKLVGIR